MPGRLRKGLFRARMKCRDGRGQARQGVGVQVAPSVSAVAPAHPCLRCSFALARPL